MPDHPTLTFADESAATADVRSGYLSGPGFTDVPVTYSVVGDTCLFQGCIDMGSPEEVAEHTAAVDARLAAEAERRAAPSTPAAEPATTVPDMEGIGLPASSSFLWPGGVVPFVIDGGLSNTSRITNAIAHFHQHTGIRFVQRTSQSNYIRFVSNGNLGWSSSPIGMRGGAQTVRISNGATTGTVIHECCHSLGILHEQSRCDRDSFVQINYQNIQSGFESNFDKFCAGFVDYFDYDFASIMHYPAGAFSTNGQPTIVPRVRGVSIGQRSALSFGDRQTIAEMYHRFFGKGHTGVWRSGSGGYALWVNASWDSFIDKWQEWGKKNLRLVDIQVRTVGGKPRYSGVWLPGTGSYALWANASWSSFVAKWKELSGKGLRLVDLHVRRVNGQNRYSGVFLPGSGGYGLWANASWSSFVAKWQQWSGQGLRLVDVNVTRVGGQTRYSGVFLPGSGGYGLWANASWSSFVAKWQQWSGQGLRLVDVNAHQTPTGTRWSGTFLPGTDGYYLWANTSWQGFRAKWEELAGQGLRLIDYEFTEPFAVADLDAAGLPASAPGAEPGAHEVAEPVEVGGVVFDDESQVVGSETGVAADVEVEPSAEGDGHGLAVFDTGESAAADQGEGVGAVVAAAGSADEPSEGAESDTGDGIGGLVLGEDAPTSGAATGDTTDEPDGIGELVGVGELGGATDLVDGDAQHTGNGHAVTATDS